MREEKIIDAKIKTDDFRVLRFFEKYGELIEEENVYLAKTTEIPREIRSPVIISDIWLLGGGPENVVAQSIKEKVYYLVLKKGPGFSTNEVRREAKRSLYGHKFEFIPYR